MEQDDYLVNMAKRKTLPYTLVLEHVSPATRLLEKRRQMFEVQEMLEQQKQEFNRKEEVFKRREEGLKKKDLELQESLIRFSKFLQENDSKRTRAEKKAQDEIKLRLAKEAEIEQLNSTLEVLKDQKVATSEVVEKSMRYQKFLENVLENIDEYHEISHLLDRYATLKATNTDLKTNLKDCDEQIESTRSALQVYTKMKTDEILNLNNRISRLKKELEERERETMALEGEKDYSLRTASEITLKHGQVEMATDNLFQRCLQRSKVNHPPYTNPLDQLSVIGDFMADLGDIVSMRHKTVKSRGKGDAR